MNMKKMNMAVAAAALLLMASCGTTKKMEGAGKVNANDKKTETKAELRSGIWLLFRKYRIIRFIPIILWAI